MLDQYETTNFITRCFGSFIGVIASMILVAPEGTKNALFRLWGGVVAGIIFAPVAHNLPMLGWLEGQSMDILLARSFASGFCAWFLLEAAARVLSSTEWIERMLREMTRLNRKTDK